MEELPEIEYVKGKMYFLIKHITIEPIIYIEKEIVKRVFNEYNLRKSNNSICIEEDVLQYTFIKLDGTLLINYSNRITNNALIVESIEDAIKEIMSFNRSIEYDEKLRQHQTSIREIILLKEHFLEKAQISIT